MVGLVPKISRVEGKLPFSSSCFIMEYTFAGFERVLVLFYFFDIVLFWMVFLGCLEYLCIYVSKDDMD